MMMMTYAVDHCRCSRGPVIILVIIIIIIIRVDGGIVTFRQFCSAWIFLCQLAAAQFFWLNLETNWRTAHQNRSSDDIGSVIQELVASSRVLRKDSWMHCGHPDQIHMFRLQRLCPRRWDRIHSSVMTEYQCVRSKKHWYWHNPKIK